MSLDQLLTECDPAQAASLATPGVDRALDALGSAIVGEARPARRRPRRLARLWLFGVARNLLLRSARRLRVADALVERLAGELRAAQPPAPTDDRAERLRSALADLSERDREIVTLTAWEGLAPREIAGVIGSSPNAVRIRLHRARNQLESRLASPEDADTAWRSHAPVIDS
jgi:RNA polymerase sigma-70 factor (ECF subfamily)